MRGASKEEKAIPVLVVDRLLLAYHEERHSRIREEVPQLPSTSQFNPHSPTEFTQHRHPMVLPQLGA